MTEVTEVNQIVQRVEDCIGYCFGRTISAADQQDIIRQTQQLLTDYAPPEAEFCITVSKFGYCVIAAVNPAAEAYLDRVAQLHKSAPVNSTK